MSSMCSGIFCFQEICDAFDQRSSEVDPNIWTTNALRLDRKSYAF